MKNWLFPRKAHPEDNNLNFVAIARLMAVFWAICAVWSVWCLVELGQTARYEPIRATVSYGDLRFVVSRVSAFSFEYEVAGHRYSSSRVMVGGRNLGRVPDEGEIQVWYDPKEPAQAIVFRELAEPVYGAIFAALVLPFLIRWVWQKYV